MLITLGILTAVVFTIAQTFRSEPTKGKKPTYGSIEVFEATVIGLAVCGGVAVLTMIIWFAWAANL